MIYLVHYTHITLSKYPMSADLHLHTNVHMMGMQSSKSFNICVYVQVYLHGSVTPSLTLKYNLICIFLFHIVSKGIASTDTHHKVVSNCYMLLLINEVLDSLYL